MNFRFFIHTIFIFTIYFSTISAQQRHCEPTKNSNFGWLTALIFDDVNPTYFGDNSSSYSKYTDQPHTGYIDHPHTGFTEHPHTGYTDHPQTGFIEYPRTGYIGYPNSGYNPYRFPHSPAVDLNHHTEKPITLEPPSEDHFTETTQPSPAAYEAELVPTIKAPMTTTINGKHISPQAVKDYIERNNGRIAALQEKHGDNPILGNTFKVVEVLNKIAMLFNDNDAHFSATATADLSRYILSNGKKFAKAIDGGILNKVPEKAQAPNRPDRYLLRNTIGTFKSAVALLSEVTHEEARTNATLHEKVTQKYIKKTQAQNAKIEKLLRALKKMTRGELLEKTAVVGSVFIFEILLLQGLKIGLTAGAVKFQEIKTEIRILRQAVNAEKTAAVAQEVVAPAMKATKDFAAASKAFVDGGAEKVKHIIDFLRHNPGILQQIELPINIR